MRRLEIYNGKVQAISGKLVNGMDALELYFENGIETFNFQFDNQGTINKWIGAISEILGSKKTTVVPNDDKGTEPTTINKKCISCSAPLVGEKGQVVHCKYCDTDQTL